MCNESQNEISTKNIFIDGGRTKLYEAISKAIQSYKSEYLGETPSNNQSASSNGILSSISTFFKTSSAKATRSYGVARVKCLDKWLRQNPGELKLIALLEALRLSTSTDLATTCFSSLFTFEFTKKTIKHDNDNIDYMDTYLEAESLEVTHYTYHKAKSEIFKIDKLGFKPTRDKLKNAGVMEFFKAFKKLPEKLVEHIAGLYKQKHPTVFTKVVDDITKWLNDPNNEELRNNAEAHFPTGQDNLNLNRVGAGK